MRAFIGIILLALTAIAHAQQQERKLVERLLQPDMTLKNTQQDKRFTGINSMHARSTSLHAFYVSEKKLTQSFAGSSKFATDSFSTRPAPTKSMTVPQSRGTPEYQTRSAPHPATISASGEKHSSTKFGGSRPFLDRGKSQKALHALDHPLSIDDVRELLNKNK